MPYSDRLIFTISQVLPEGDITAKAVIRGTGEYGGEKTISFKIGMRSITDVRNGAKQFLGRF